MRRNALSCLLVCLAILPWTRVHAAAVTDASSGLSFEVHERLDDISMRCVGAGVRRLLFVKVYAAAFCLQESAVAPLMHAWTHWHEDENVEHRVDMLSKHVPFFEAISSAPGAKLVQMKMLRDVSASRLADAFRDSLVSVLSKPKIERIIAAIPGDMHKGDLVWLASTAGGEVRIRIGQQEKRLRDEEIAKKIWRVWLGPDSVSPSLKYSLAQWAMRSERSI